MASSRTSRISSTERVTLLVNRLLHGIIIFKQSQLSCKTYTLCGTSDPVSKSIKYMASSFSNKTNFLARPISYVVRVTRLVNRLFKFRDFMNTLRNFAKSVFAHIFSKFEKMSMGMFSICKILNKTKLN